MDLEFDDDQLVLMETIQAIIAKECSPAFVRSVVEDGTDPSGWWSTMVDLDWPALVIGEDSGGLGLTWIELTILLEELGRACDPSPFVATTTQFVPAIRRCGSVDQIGTWLSAVAAGSLTGALALGAKTVQAAAVTDGWRLDGTARYVVDADRADEIAVVAADEDGVGVFVVNRSAAGDALHVERIPTFDQTAHVADIELANVVIDSSRRLGGTDIEDGLVGVEDEATLGWSVITVGACQRILDLVVEHVKQRHQFGVPIGSFQAVKHKVVDMYVAVERARALSHYAALTVVEDDPRRSTAVSMAKAAAGDCQDVVFQHGFQLFGGMGFTWENDLQFALRRAKLGAMMFGSTSEHHRRIAREVLVG